MTLSRLELGFESPWGRHRQTQGLHSQAFVLPSFFLKPLIRAAFGALPNFRILPTTHDW